MTTINYRFKINLYKKGSYHKSGKIAFSFYFNITGKER